MWRVPSAKPSPAAGAASEVTGMEEKNTSYNNMGTRTSTSGIEDFSSAGTTGGSLNDSTMNNNSSKSVKETFRTGSPDEVRERVKEMVQKGVAAVAGALKGFTEESQKGKIAEQTRESIKTLGETTREAVSSTTEQVKNMEEPLKKAGDQIKHTGQTLGSTARDVGSTAKDELNRTRQEMKGSGGGQGGKPDATIIAYEETTITGIPPTTGSIGSTGGSSYSGTSGGSSGIAGSGLGTSGSSGSDMTSSYNKEAGLGGGTGQGTEFPGSSSTPKSRKSLGSDKDNKF